MSTPTAERPLLNAARVQWRVIDALISREMVTRFGQSKLGYLWAVIEPLMFIGVFTAIFTFLGRQGSAGMPLIPFLMTGITTFLTYMRMEKQISQAVKSNRPLLFFSQVSTIDFVMARFLLDMTTSVLVFGILITAVHLFGLSGPIERPLLLIFAFLSVTLLALGMGMIEMSLIVFFPVIERIVPIINRPLFIISGLFYTAEDLPPGIREYLLYNPLLHINEFVRSAYFHQFESAYASVTYLGGWILLSLALGFLLERMIRRRS